MPRNPWTGLIGHIGRVTTDNRILELVHVEDTPLPLMYAHIDADYYDARIAGSIDAVNHFPDGGIRAEGTTDLPPGEYAIGMDLAQVQPGREPGTLRGTLIGATVHDHPDSAAWPDATITVLAP
jgi:hypothetical protein